MVALHISRHDASKSKVPIVEELQEALKRMKRPPISFGPITITCIGRFSLPSLGGGYKFLLRGLRSDAHRKQRAGEYDTVVLWVLDGNGLGYFDISPGASDHISLRTPQTLLRAFDTKHFQTVQESLKMSGGQHGTSGIFTHENRMWMHPVLVVYVICWLIPGAYALGTMLLMRHLNLAAPQNLLPTAELAAELAILDGACSSVAMYPDIDTGVHYLTKEQLAGNPLDVMEFSMSNATDLHYLHESMRRAMPAEADPAKVDWLQQLCTERDDFTMDEAALHTMAKMLTVQEEIQGWLAQEMRAYQQMKLEISMIKLKIKEGKEKMEKEKEEMEKKGKKEPLSVAELLATWSVPDMLSDDGGSSESSEDEDGSGLIYPLVDGMGGGDGFGAAGQLSLMPGWADWQFTGNSSCSQQQSSSYDGSDAGTSDDANSGSSSPRDHLKDNESDGEAADTAAASDSLSK